MLEINGALYKIKQQVDCLITVNKSFLLTKTFTEEVDNIIETSVEVVDKFDVSILGRYYVLAIDRSKAEEYITSEYPYVQIIRKQLLSAFAEKGFELLPVPIEHRVIIQGKAVEKIFPPSIDKKVFDDILRNNVFQKLKEGWDELLLTIQQDATLNAYYSDTDSPGNFCSVEFFYHLTFSRQELF